MILVYSRHMYVHITRRQRLEDVIDGMEPAWEFFGRISTRVTLDNLKAAIIRADCYDPIFQRTFGEYADHRGFVIDPAANTANASPRTALYGYTFKAIA